MVLGMAKRTYQNSKEAIIQSAIRVLSKEGFQGFTTDAVIRESGLSKAGFFYNFKTKKELLEAVVAKLNSEWTDEISELESEDRNPVGRVTRANLRASFDHYKKKDQSKVALYSALTEMTLAQPDFFQELADGWSKPSLKDGVPIEQQMIVYLVIDGLFSQMIMPTFKMTEKQREKVFEILIRMTEAPLKLESKGSSK